MAFESLLERIGEYCERLGERTYQRGEKRAQSYLARNPPLKEIKGKECELFHFRRTLPALSLLLGVHGEQEYLENYLRKIDPPNPGILRTKFR